ncbi:TIGR02677 family protein [Paraburkholderia edwinii]|uniref:TIGR02677 family protein n=1 Tax=Paraburkholderia edwinii TaxID=2861782 RepID=UPI001FE3B24D|nr:TIGR02677 family protein [Paraburkholderia edwinii]
MFKHVTAEKARLYRAILDVFATAKRQYRLQLRPDEIMDEAAWPDEVPRSEDLNLALAQLSEWGNLQSQPDTARVSTLNDFYRARFLYRLSAGGEAIEAALATFSQSLRRKAELQTVALEDIASRLSALLILLNDSHDELDVPKVHEILRDLVQVFEKLADNAQAFMAGVARSMELHQAEANVVANYKRRLIDYLERFLGDLVHRSDAIAAMLQQIAPRINSALQQVAEREARDAAPADELEAAEERTRRWREWLDRWKGLRGWFLASGQVPPQADLLRSRARAAIPQLLGAIAAINDRRSGRSDRSADFRTLAGWFAACESNEAAHRLARAAFALNPARHYSINPIATEDVPASTSWADAPPLEITPRLREYGEMAPRGPLPKVRDRSAERALLSVQFAEESRQVETARQRLATGRQKRLSDLGELNTTEFSLFLNLLGEALSEQADPDTSVERHTGDGLLLIRLEPLERGSFARIHTPAGTFSGRDHLITITEVDG